MSKWQHYDITDRVAQKLESDQAMDFIACFPSFVKSHLFLRTLARIHLGYRNSRSPANPHPLSLGQGITLSQVGLRELRVNPKMFWSLPLWQVWATLGLQPVIWTTLGPRMCQLDRCPGLSRGPRHPAYSCRTCYPRKRQHGEQHQPYHEPDFLID